MHGPSFVLSVSIALLAVPAGGAAQEDRESSDFVSKLAARVAEEPSAEAALCLARARDRFSRPREFALALQQAVDRNRAKSGSQDIEVAALWQRLPLRSSEISSFSKELEAVPSCSSPSPWFDVFRLYLAAVRGARGDVVRWAGKVKAPETFPTAYLDQAFVEVARSLGESKARAGVRAIEVREFDALYALGDLDRRLTRELEYLKSSGREEESSTVRACRDRLRLAYLSASRCVVERLFALKILGRKELRAELVEAARGAREMTKSFAVARKLSELGEERAWQEFVEPLLVREAEFVLTLAKGKTPAVTESAKVIVRIEADSSEIVDGGDERKATRYEGGVRLTFGSTTLSADRIDLIEPPVRAVASGSARLRGFPGVEGELSADSIDLFTDSGRVAVRGDVRVRISGKKRRLRSCQIDADGTFGAVRSAFDDYRDETNSGRRRELLREIEALYAASEIELDDETRYELAVQMIRPHLRWFPLRLPPRERGGAGRAHPLLEKVEVLRELSEGGVVDPWIWSSAHSGDERLRGDVPPEIRQELERAKEQINASATGRRPRSEESDETDFYWRLADPTHADVERAISLFESVRQGPWRRRAQHWAVELERNNTVLSFDVGASFAPKEKAAVTLDVRNVDEVELSVYRVRSAEDLVSACSKIGAEFVFRDHSLSANGKAVGLERQRGLQESMQHSPWGRPEVRELVFREADKIRTWKSKISDLETYPFYALRGRPGSWSRLGADGTHSDLYERGPYARFFDDGCSAYTDRVGKVYHPGQSLSAWRCDLIVDLEPGDLAKPGAYVIAARANGQSSIAPLLVDPLSMALRRNRDGVLVVVSNPDGTKPLEGAEVFTAELRGAERTDSAGVAFVNSFAAGDRALIAKHGERFAVGGFGVLFDGVYRSEAQRLLEGRRGRVRERGLEEAELEILQRASGLVYADRYVVAAYTDRPLYRPGQEIGLKMIVRRLARDGKRGREASERFRSRDFDVSSRLESPVPGSRFEYRLLDARGKAVENGSARLTDFGTSSFSWKIPEESATGAYELHCTFDGVDHVVPDVFRVEYYRRPHLRVELNGVPEVTDTAKDLRVDVVSEYYFGKPAAGAVAEFSLRGEDGFSEIAEASRTLDASGRARTTLYVPHDLRAGRYVVVAAVRDASGRKARAIRSWTLRRPATDSSEENRRLPRFVAVGEPIRVSSDGRDEEIRFEKPGWHEVEVDGTKGRIFAYGGTERSFEIEPGAGWIRLSRDRTINVESAFNSPDLAALFDTHRVTVAGKLRVLLYAPVSSGRVVLTLEGRTIADYVSWEIPSGSTSRYHVVEIPVLERARPNFYLRGFVLPSLEAQLAEFDPDRAREARVLERLEKKRERRGDGSVDLAWCRVDVDSSESAAAGGNSYGLTVDVEPSRTRLAPGDPLGVRVVVRDAEGNPTQAEVSVAVVDESILANQPEVEARIASVFRDPRPQRRYLSKAWRASLGSQWKVTNELLNRRNLDLISAITIEKMASLRREMAAKALHELVQENLGARRNLAPQASDAMLPVGELPWIRLRSDFRETAGWFPHVRTDANGVANVDLRLPDSLTAYRISTVGINTGVDLGFASARVQVSKPISAQLFLPRFAIVGDELEARAVFHNRTEKRVTLVTEWTVDGVKREPRSVEVDAASQAWQVVPLSWKSVGISRIEVRCVANGGAGAIPLSDAVERTLEVESRGRAREFLAGGTFRGKHRVEFPEGYTPEDVQISVGVGRLGDALDGLEYLVEYPHGCVEQTMSRFLPAVAVRRAISDSAIDLPAVVLAKLPEAIERGLRRLNGFQNKDGGWGWWNEGRSDPRMTAYVVYGLALCSRVGVDVDAQALSGGCQRLERALENEKLSGEIEARAWRALATAGRAVANGLAAEIRAEGFRSRTTLERLLLTLAASHAGLPREVAAAWKSVREDRVESTEEVALRLRAQVELGSALADCDETVAGLADRKRGHRWENTRATAAAILSLSKMVGYAGGSDSIVRSVSVSVDGERSHDSVAAKAGSPKSVHRFELDLDAESEQRPVILIAVNGAGDEDQPRAQRFSLTARGTQRLDLAEATGDEVRVERSFVDGDGKPVANPVGVGETVRVRLRVVLKEPQRYLILEDRRPAAFEYVDERPGGTATKDLVHAEFRDDRASFFFSELSEGDHEIFYDLRAESRGLSHALPAVAYPMYDEDKRGETEAAKLRVE